MSKIFDPIVEYLNNKIKEYCKIVAKTHNLDEEVLYKLWQGEIAGEPIKPVIKKPPVVKKSSPKVSDHRAASASTYPDEEKENEEDLSSKDISKKNKQELIEMCKTKKLKISGTKDELKARLLEALGLSEDNDKVEKKVEKKSSPKPPATKSIKNPVEDSDVIKKTTKTLQENIKIAPNKYGNYEHLETGLVFDKKTSQAFGTQQKDGTIAELTFEDIENCKKYNFKYTLPDNILSKDIDNKPVEHLEEEEDSQVEEIIEEEELLEEDN